jgi:hypothetical protein
MIQAGRYAATQKRLKNLIHKHPSVLPAAWKFYQAFHEIPDYRDFFTGLAAVRKRTTAWTAEVTVGERNSYRLRLKIPVQLTGFSSHLHQVAEAEYFITEGTKLRDGAFEVNPHGLQARLLESAWNVDDGFARLDRIERAIERLRDREVAGSCS